MKPTRSTSLVFALALAAESTLLWGIPASNVPHQAGCLISVERTTLRVVGDDAPNLIEISGTPEGVRVTCDGASETHAAVEEISVEAAGADDRIFTDHRNVHLAFIPIHISGGEGDDFTGCAIGAVVPGQDFAETGALPQFDGGVGSDQLVVATSGRADEVAIERRPNDVVEVRVRDVATELRLADVIASHVEILKVLAGHGDDVGAIGVDVLLGNTASDLLFDWAGEFGHDELKVLGDSAPENYAITPVAVGEFPDPRIQVTDPATGAIVADIFVQQTEAIGIATAGGDDVLEVHWEIASMSGLAALRADLGDGDDAMTAHLLPVLLAPDAGEIQRLVFDVDAGRGDDLVALRHAAGGWFDVVFAARLGAGRDRFEAVFGPPPDDGVPSPEGERRVQLDVSAGRENDVVSVGNGAGGGLFRVFAVGDLGIGDDLFEAFGEVTPDARPGRGFDTARVTRNLLPFVAEFERVEVVERVP